MKAHNPYSLCIHKMKAGLTEKQLQNGCLKFRQISKKKYNLATNSYSDTKNCTFAAIKSQIFKKIYHMKILDTLKYTPNHEWLQLEGDEALVGVTDFAQSQLGDIVFVEVETVGEILEKGESFGTIEAVKTVEDIYLPVSGEILEFNEALNANPELINKEPYEGGWVVRIKVTNPSEVASLLDAVAYEKHVAESAH